MVWRFKRTFDVAGACAGVVVFTPVAALAALAVIIEDGRPVVFRLELDRTYAWSWNPLLDCWLIARSFVVNVLGKTRVQRMLRR